MSTDVLISADEFQTAGLDPEGVYRMHFKSLAVVEKIAQSGKNVGNPYKRIEGQVDLVEKLGDGLLEYPINAYFSAYTSGRQLQKFRNLYVAKYGKVPTSQPGQISLAELTSAMAGVDDVWGVLYWKRDRENPDVIRQELGYSYSTDPTTIKAPKSFADRNPDRK